MREFKLENDSDIHVVLSPIGSPSETMIAEFVDVGCTQAGKSSQREAMLSARESFVAICGEPSPSFRVCHAQVEITGVGFFDFLHGQTGVAPNGIELHPVLAVSRIAEDTPSASNATAPPVAPVPINDPTPVVTVTPSAQTLSLVIVSVTSPAHPGGTATLKASTASGASCTITVRYYSGPSRAAGLVDKVADGGGNVSWTWNVGTRTTPGEWPIYVSCTLGGVTAQASTAFTVQ